MTKTVACAALSALILTGACATLFAHEGRRHNTTVNTSADTSAAVLPDTPAAPAGGDTTIGVDEKPGAMIPLDLPFVNDAGDTVMLRTLVRGPTVLCFLFYGCKNACSTLLTGLATTLRSFADNPATAPDIVTISISPRETPKDAATARGIALQSIQKPYPPDKWQFLTGPEASIRGVTAAAGFRFARKGDDYDHPLCLIIISAQGKITRYIMGSDYLPVDLTMSLMEASDGTVRPTIARVLRMCFSYDPRSHRFVFSVLRVSLAVIGVLVGVFVIFLIVSGRNRRIRKGPHT